MKKQKLFFLALMAAVNVSMAQISISQPDMLNLGSEFVLASDLLPNVSAGKPGANRTWDFSNLAVFDLDTAVVMSPDQSPNGPWVSSNRVVYYKGSGEWVYYRNLHNGLSMVGKSDSTGNHLSKPESPVLRYPASYGQNQENLFRIESIRPVGYFVGYVFIDSIKVVKHYVVSQAIDAWGSMTTPGGTYDVLRQNQLVTQTDSVWMKSRNGGWQKIPDIYVYYTRNFRFFSKEYDFPLVTLLDSDDDGLAGEVQWIFENKVSGIGRDEQLDRIIRIYPNPAGEFLKVQSLDYTPGEIQIFQSNGKLVLKDEINFGENALNISNLSAGTYLVKTVIEGKVYSETLIIQ